LFFVVSLLFPHTVSRLTDCYKNSRGFIRKPSAWASKKFPLYPVVLAAYRRREAKIRPDNDSLLEAKFGICINTKFQGDPHCTERPGMEGFALLGGQKSVAHPTRL
jgi:hypothetical protein